MNNVVTLASILSCERRYYVIITLVDNTDSPVEESMIQSTANAALISIYSSQSDKVKEIGLKLVRPLRFRDQSQREYLDDIASQVSKLC